MSNLRSELTKKQQTALLKLSRTAVPQKSLKTVILALTLNTSLIFCSPLALAAAIPTPVCTTCEMIDKISAKLSEIHDKNVGIMYDLLRSIDKTISEGNTSTFNLIAEQPTIDKSINNRNSNLINYYLEGMYTQEYETSALAYAPLPPPLPADKYNPAIKPYPAFVFSQANDAISEADDYPPASAKIEEMLNMDTLMGPIKYDDTGKSEARWLIRYLEALSPPPDIINISDNFVIPYSPDSDDGTTIINLKEDLKKNKLWPAKDIYSIISAGNKPAENQNVKNLKKDLNAISAYREYLVSYRSAIAARSMMLNTLLKLYQARLAAPKQSAKSPAEIEYESATRRLSTDYYNKIMGTTKTSTSAAVEPASPITVEREMLFLLAEIHHDLYQMRQQNDRLLAMQAVSGLQMSQMGALLGGSKTKKIAKLIYCSPSLGHKDESACTKNSQSSSSSTTEAPAAPAE